MTVCPLCRDNEIAEKNAPDYDRVHVTPNYRVLVRESQPLGWLLVVPRRHVEAIADLTDGETDELAHVIRAASRALRAVLGVARTYEFVFADIVDHIHFNVVPCVPDMPLERRGANVLSYRQLPTVPDEERNAIARKLAVSWPD